MKSGFDMEVVLFVLNHLEQLDKFICNEQLEGVIQFKLESIPSFFLISFGMEGKIMVLMVDTDFFDLNIGVFQLKNASY